MEPDLTDTQCNEIIWSLDLYARQYGLGLPTWVGREPQQEQMASMRVLIRQAVKEAPAHS